MKTYLITGASTGIGEQLSVEAIGQGHKVYGLARSGDKLKAIAERLGDNFVPIVCDVSKQRSVKTACKKLEDTPDIVILNAGIGVYDNRKTFEISKHVETFAVNYFGVLYFVEELFDKFQERGRGIFVATSSLAGYRGLPQAAAYSASKAAISTAMESMRLTYNRWGIDFYTIHPGFIDTPMTQNANGPYPLMWKADKAARHILKQIDNGKQNINFPWPIWLAVILGRLVPAWLYLKLLKM